ncbi:LysR family transcriptional regulator [Aliiroseovarius subalbicans]|uniref:LysR family transcriptional regulator n=1 Tax=Aliiroseovarius subalbicans TaxID=2925840 RepID=UPI001F598ED3|nr:LysR family transcriptional regulator [Aliiroseovarius subalbicans]MCI2398552.1 LysR family transcriptional regulator [Aliiroseovarius subalbicans]
MQWDDARIFLAFAREGSFSNAAKRLGVRHSTVSRRIHALEENLATALIERSSTGYVLTKAGQDLHKTATRMENELLAFEAESSGEKEDVAGELRVAAIANMASTVLMPIFSRFLNAYPNIDLRVEVTNDSVRLAERDADVALRQTNSPGKTLVGTRLTTVASAVYGSADYCAAVKAGEAEETWVGVDCCDYHRAWTKQARPQGDHSFVVDETSLTAAALKVGLGVGYLPCFLGDSDPALTRYREPEIQHNLGLWLLYHRDLRNTKRVTLFREHMQREIKSVAVLFEGSA